MYYRFSKDGDCLLSAQRIEIMQPQLSQCSDEGDIDWIIRFELKMAFVVKELIDQGRTDQTLVVATTAGGFYQKRAVKQRSGEVDILWSADDQNQDRAAVCPALSIRLSEQSGILSKHDVAYIYPTYKGSIAYGVITFQDQSPELVVQRVIVAETKIGELLSSAHSVRVD